MLRGNSTQRRRGFEQGGSRTYLRFIRLTLFLIVGMTVLSILLLFVLFLSNRRGRPEDVDSNVVAPTATPQDNNKPALQPATPGPTPRKVIQQPGAVVPASPTPSPTRRGLGCAGREHRTHREGVRGGVGDGGGGGDEQESRGRREDGRGGRADKGKINQEN